MFGLFNKKQNDSKMPENKHLAGALSITKGDKLTITKTDVIKVTASWTDPTKDYDLMALVLYHNGVTRVVWHKELQTEDGAVKHLGDVGATAGDKTETLEIRMANNVARVAVFAYSAIENGAGSFREYGVSVLIDNGKDQPVGIQAAEASSDRNRYTLCFGEVVNGDSVTIEAHELYSKNGSERQPAYVNGKLTMDAGILNTTK